MAPLLPPKLQQVRQHWVEWLLALIIVVGVVYCGIHVWLYGYLPPPFFFEPSDTFADWFNPAFWSRQQGVYDTWRSIYWPFSFVFLRFFGLDYCYPSTRGFESSAGLVARDCDWLGLSAIACIMVLNLVLTWRALRRIDPATAPMRTICLIFGAPMLNALERGNLMILAYTCLLLAFGPLVRSARVRWFFAGIAVNLKIYLIASIIPHLLKRRWRWVEGALLSTILIYLVSIALLGNGTPQQILVNLRDFSSQDSEQILDQWYTTTYRPLLSLLESGVFPLSQIIGSLWVERLLVILPALVILTQVLTCIAAFAIWFRPSAFTVNRTISLGMLIAVITSEPGGYAMSCVLLFVLFEPWRGFGRKWAIVSCYVLAFPFDLPIDRLPDTTGSLYFRDTDTMVSHYVTLGPFIRPLIIISISWALALATINEVWGVLKRERGAVRCKMSPNPM